MGNYRKPWVESRAHEEGLALGGWKKGLAGFLWKGLLICVSFVAVFVVTYRLNQSYLQQVVETQAVVTAITDILPGEALDPGNLQLSEKAVFGLGGDLITDLHAFLENGPWYAGDIGIGAGDILRPERLVNAAAYAGDWRWAFDQREGARLIAIETSLARSSGDWLWPGALVDALVYIPAKESYEDSRPSQVIGPDDDPFLRGLLVIDKKNANGMSLGEGAAEEGYSRDALPAVVTLMIEEGDIGRAMALVRYNEEGRIYLSPSGAYAQ